MSKILIIEDDNDINNMLSELLVTNSYNVKCAFSGTEGLMYYNNEEFDLLLVDLMLPGKDGLTIVKEIKQKDNIPIIILTAINDKQKLVELLKSGADDYITKPFDIDELLIRIEVQLRKPVKKINNDILYYKNIIIDSTNYIAYIDNININLSKIEFDIFKILVSNSNRVFTKNNLYEMAWQNSFLGDDNTINVHISKIRSKIHKVDKENEYIKTIWGIGFKIS